MGGRVAGCLYAKLAGGCKDEGDGAIRHVDGRLINDVPEAGQEVRRRLPPPIRC